MFLAALQPYKTSCPWSQEECKNNSSFSALLSKHQKDRKTGRQTDRLFSLVIKTKVAKNVNRMSERQTKRPTDRKTERFFSLLIKTKVVQNVNWMSERQKDRNTDRQIQKDRQKTERLFSLVIKTKVVKNVNRMSERQKDRPKDSQTDIQTERLFSFNSYQNKNCSECQQDVRKITRAGSLAVRTGSWTIFLTSCLHS